MARKVFYSFHYKRDVQRAAQIRNSHSIADEDEYGVIDGVDWEKIEQGGKEAVKKWINEQLRYTSVTAVLIGAETAERDWVDYEIRRSWERGNALVGVRIHNVKNLDGKTDVPGPNPFDNIYFVDDTPLSSICKTYDWVANDGISNLGKWVEEAFQERESYTGEKNLRNSDNNVDSSINRSPTGSLSQTRPAIIQNPPKPWVQ